MQQTGTTAPLTGTIDPKCSFSDRVLEIATPLTTYLIQNKAPIYQPNTPKNPSFYDRVLVPFPDTTEASMAEIRNTPTLTSPHQRFPLTPSSLGNLNERITKVHLAVRADADHFEVAPPLLIPYGALA